MFPHDHRRTLAAVYLMLATLYYLFLWMKQNHLSSSNKRLTVSNGLDTKNLSLSPVEYESKTENLFVYTPGQGRLGNLLFQYMSVVGIAEHTSRTAVFGPRMLILEEIFPRIKINVMEVPPKLWRTMTERAVWDFDENLFIRSEHNITIDGFLSSFRYFEAISSRFYKEILSYFRKPLLSKAKHFIGHAKTNYISGTKLTVLRTVCLHVRRGDKATQKAHDLYSFQMPTAQEIKNAMNYMQKAYKPVIFIVASDTIEWCKQYLHGNNVYFSNMTSFYEDFVLMSSCDHMIMTVGTFGWWASWLTAQRGGTSMYYSQPFVKGSKKDKALNRHNSFPDDWIPYNSSILISAKL